MIPIVILTAFSINVALTVFSNFTQKKKIESLEIVVGELSERTTRLLEQNKQLLSLYLEQNKQLLSLLDEKGIRDKKDLVDIDK
jgi:hypothetical protein